MISFFCKFIVRRLRKSPCTLHCSLLLHFPPKMRGYEEPHFVLLIELCEKRKAFVVMLLGCRQSHYNKEKIAYGILINVLNLQRDH